MFMYTLLAYAVSTVSLDVKYHPHAVGLRPLPTMFASSVGFFRKCQRQSRYEGAVMLCRQKRLFQTPNCKVDWSRLTRVLPENHIRA
jgi:hypothetical protein